MSDLDFTCLECGKVSAYEDGCSCVCGGDLCMACQKKYTINDDSFCQQCFANGGYPFCKCGSNKIAQICCSGCDDCVCVDCGTIIDQPGYLNMVYCKGCRDYELQPFYNCCFCVKRDIPRELMYPGPINDRDPMCLECFNKLAPRKKTT